MPPKILPADERLMAAYREAALRIQRTLEDLTPRNRRVILRRIDIILGELDSLSADYLQESLPLHFKDGSDEAIRQLRKLQGFGDAIDETFGAIHKEAMKALSDNAKLKFASTLRGVKEAATTRINARLKQNIIGELLASEIEGASNPAARVKEIFQEEGVTAFRGSRRNIPLEEYSALLTHNVLAESHNTGAATRYAANGVGFARRIERADCCNICRPLRDKIISLADPRLLPPTHPWCYGGVSPILGVPDEEPIMSPDDKRIPEETRKHLMRER